MASAEVIVVDLGLHTDEVDDAAEGILLADGKLHGHGIGAEALADHLLDAEEVCAVDVHLVDVCDAGDVILVRLAPHRLGLRLDTALCAERRDGAVEDAERTLDFDREVNVAGGIDDVEAVALPDTGRCSGRDGDAALLLLDHPVHRSGAFMHLAELVRLARIEQDTLGRGGLAGVDVRHDTEVSRVL